MFRCEYPVVTRSFSGNRMRPARPAPMSPYTSPLSEYVQCKFTGGLGAGPQEGGSQGVSP
jgi:hypothetical protein